MYPTWTSRRPKATSASMIRRHAFWLVASGFSQNTGLPAPIAASTYSSWVGPQEQTTIASTLSWAISSWPVANTLGARDPGRDLLRLLGVHIGDRDDRGTGKHLG